MRRLQTKATASISLPRLRENGPVLEKCWLGVPAKEVSHTLKSRHWKADEIG